MPVWGVDLQFVTDIISVDVFNRGKKEDPFHRFSTLLSTDKLAKQEVWLHNLRRSVEVTTVEITALSMPLQ